MFFAKFWDTFKIILETFFANLGDLFRSFSSHFFITYMIFDEVLKLRVTADSIETRQNNYLVIMDFFSKESSDEYKDYFKTLYPDGVTNGRWAQDSVG